MEPMDHGFIPSFQHLRADIADTIKGMEVDSSLSPSLGDGRVLSVKELASLGTYYLY